MQSTKEISPDVLDILKTVEIDGQNVRITVALDRPTYVKVNEALDRIGGQWKSGKTKAHVFPEGKDPAVLIAGLLESEAMPAKNPLAFFGTPRKVAKQAIALALEYAPECANGSILEPQAGEGGIVDELPKTATVTLVELDSDRCDVLRRKGYDPIQADFLTLAPTHQVDAVIMNPPFAVEGNQAAYVDHILRAERWVKPGGVIVAIVPAGFSFNQTRKIASFRKKVQASGEFHGLEDNSFKESGTGVAAIVLAYQVGVSSDA